MEIKIDQDLCIGCGVCASLCPKSFRMDEALGKAEASAHDDPSCARNAAESCPVQAIAVK